MARQGDWLTPRFMGRYALYKPPLLIWAAAASSKLLGVSRLSLRLPIALLSALALGLIFLWAGELAGWQAGAVAGGLQQTPGRLAAVLAPAHRAALRARPRADLPMGRRTRRLAGRSRGRRPAPLQSPVAHAGRALHDRRPAARLLHRRFLRPLLRPVAGIARGARRLLRRGGGRHPHQRDRGHPPAGRFGAVLGGRPAAGAPGFLARLSGRGFGPGLRRTVVPLPVRGPPAVVLDRALRRRDPRLRRRCAPPDLAREPGAVLPDAPRRHRPASPGRRGGGHS